MNRIEVLDKLIADEEKLIQLEEEGSIASYESKARLDELLKLKSELTSQEEKKKDKFLDYCIRIAEIVIPSVVSIMVMVNQNRRMERAILFEQTGSFTTTATKAVAKDIFKN